MEKQQIEIQITQKKHTSRIDRGHDSVCCNIDREAKQNKRHTHTHTHSRFVYENNRDQYGNIALNTTKSIKHLTWTHERNGALSINKQFAVTIWIEYGEDQSLAKETIELV